MIDVHSVNRLKKLCASVLQFIINSFVAIFQCLIPFQVPFDVRENKAADV